MNAESGHNQNTQKKLGFFNRLILLAADLTKAVGGIIREDSHKSRTAYWTYIGALAIITPICLGLALLPGPNVLGIGLALSSGIIFAGAIKGLDKLGVSKWAKRKNEKYLADVFNGAALIKKYDAYIHPKESKPGSFYVHKRKLLGSIFNKAGSDVHEVSSTRMRKAFSLMNKYALKPITKGLTAIYNKVTGHKDDNDHNPSDKPPNPPNSGQGSPEP